MALPLLLGFLRELKRVLPPFNSRSLIRFEGGRLGLLRVHFNGLLHFFKTSFELIDDFVSLLLIVIRRFWHWHRGGMKGNWFWLRIWAYLLLFRLWLGYLWFLLLDSDWVQVITQFKKAVVLNIERKRQLFRLHFADELAQFLVGIKGRFVVSYLNWLICLVILRFLPIRGGVL